MSEPQTHVTGGCKYPRRRRRSSVSAGQGHNNSFLTAAGPAKRASALVQGRKQSDGGDGKTYTPLWLPQGPDDKRSALTRLKEFVKSLAKHITSDGELDHFLDTFKEQSPKVRTALIKLMGQMKHKDQHAIDDKEKMHALIKPILQAAPCEQALDNKIGGFQDLAPNTQNAFMFLVKHTKHSKAAEHAGKCQKAALDKRAAADKEKAAADRKVAAAHEAAAKAKATAADAERAAKEANHLKMVAKKAQSAKEAAAKAAHAARAKATKAAAAVRAAKACPTAATTGKKEGHSFFVKNVFEHTRRTRDELKDEDDLRAWTANFANAPKAQRAKILSNFETLTGAQAETPDENAKRDTKKLVRLYKRLFSMYGGEVKEGAKALEKRLSQGEQYQVIQLIRKASTPQAGCQ